jgi:acetyl esterase/lipase
VRARRWLAGAVGLELLLGGLALVAVTADAPGDTGAFPAASPTELVGVIADTLRGRGDAVGREAAANDTGSGGGRRGRAEQVPSAGSGGAFSSDALGSSPSAGHPPTTEKGISFRPPVGFATGAAPSSAEFNKAEGDQVAAMLVHLPVTDSVATGDLDGDGDTDVVQTNVVAGSLSIFLGDGRGGFAAPVLRPLGGHPDFVVAGDLDVDGDLDLAVADSGANGVSILLGDGRGSFVTTGVLSVPHPRNVAIGRIDNDDLPDLAVASAGATCPRAAATPQCEDSPSTGGVRTFLGLAGGTFRPAQFLPLTHSASSRPVGANAVALHDFNGDGLGDLAVTVGARSSAFVRPDGATLPTGDDLLVFLNGDDAVQPFAFSPDQAIRIGSMPDAIAVGDWDGDAHPDLATLETTSGSITTLLGDERGYFRVRATNVSVGALARGLAVGDFDDDGTPDLVTASFAASTVSVLEGNGDGTFQPAVDHWVGDEPTGVAVGNFDADGRLDLVAARLRTDQLTLMINDGPEWGDGVVIHRDISYSPMHPDDDPYAAHHTLDVYVPPKGTPPFAGPGDSYPVVLFAHGGGGIALDKSYNSYLLRSLAARGIVVVSMNYRLGSNVAAEQTLDGIHAFRWTVDHIRSFAGDPWNVFAFGYSAGAAVMNQLATGPQLEAEQAHIRGLVLVGHTEAAPGSAAVIPESLLLSGDEGLERALWKSSDDYAAASRARGTNSTPLHIPGRDHVTLVADLALPDDPGRIAIDAFLWAHLDP